MELRSHFSHSLMSSRTAGCAAQPPLTPRHACCSTAARAGRRCLTCPAAPRSPRRRPRAAPAGSQGSVEIWHNAGRADQLVRMVATQPAAASGEEPRPRPRLRVVDVGRGHIVLARLVAPGAAEHAIVAADGRLVPGQPAAEPVPAACLVLRRPCTSAAHGACTPPSHRAVRHATMQQCGGLAARAGPVNLVSKCTVTACGVGIL
jgi:hypothetical protein